MNLDTDGGNLLESRDMLGTPFDFQTERRMVNHQKRRKDLILVRRFHLFRLLVQVNALPLGDLFVEKTWSVCRVRDSLRNHVNLIEKH